MPFGLLSLGIGAGTTALGTFMQARNNRRLRNAANNLSLDTSELDNMYGRLQGADINGQAMRDVRAAGIGFDQDQFTQNAAVRGAGRNSFGVLRQEAQERGQQDFATAVQGRQDALRNQNYQQQLGVANSLLGARQSLMQTRAGMLGQSAAQNNQMWGGIADMGAVGMGMGAESLMSPGIDPMTQMGSPMQGSGTPMANPASRVVGGTTGQPFGYQPRHHTVWGIHSGGGSNYQKYLTKE